MSCRAMLPYFRAGRDFVSPHEPLPQSPRPGRPRRTPPCCPVARLAGSLVGVFGRSSADQTATGQHFENGRTAGRARSRREAVREPVPDLEGHRRAPGEAGPGHRDRGNPAAERASGRSVAQRRAKRSGPAAIRGIRAAGAAESRDALAGHRGEAAFHESRLQPADRRAGKLRGQPQRRVLPVPDPWRRRAPAPARFARGDRAADATARAQSRPARRRLAAEHRLHDPRRVPRRRTGAVADRSRGVRVGLRHQEIPRRRRPARAGRGRPVGRRGHGRFRQRRVPRPAGVRLRLPQPAALFSQQRRRHLHRSHGRGRAHGPDRRAEHGPGRLQQRRLRGRFHPARRLARQRRPVA